jgi:hypothetical protein
MPIFQASVSLGDAIEIQYPQGYAAEILMLIK